MFSSLSSSKQPSPDLGLSDTSSSQGLRPISSNLVDNQFPPAPSPKDEKNQYEEEAFFSIKHRNNKLLDLLLGPKPDILEIQQKETSTALEQVKYNGERREQLLVRAAFLDANIIRLEKFLSSGGKQKELEDNLDKQAEDNLKYIESRQAATAERILNGNIYQISKEDQMKPVEALRAKHKIDKFITINDKETQALIQETDALSRKEFNSNILRRDELLRECAHLAEIITKWNDLAQQANDTNTFERDKKLMQSS